MGNIILDQPILSKNTSIKEGKTLMYATSEMQGWRAFMEDVHIHVCDCAPYVSIFGVFDGHGSSVVARFIQKHFIEELQKNKNFRDQNYEEALKENFLKMDELIFSPQGQKEIQEMKLENDDITFAGSTANVALFHKNILYVANAGDSRSVLCRNNTNYDMSVDHLPDNYEEKQRIERAGGFVSDGRINGNINISRGIGDIEYKKVNKLRSNEQMIIAVPDIKKVELTPNDKFLLMGCNGIFETLDHANLIKLINSKLGNQPVTPQLLGKVAEDLLDHLIAPDTSAGTGCDNMTVLIIYFK
ncbi:unnamed protein product [Paramecium sonneborni]|uniref:protein-serine/threonine phosphatase n=1 Tax=Paramecium sonneborni TaxID=65129 RepID=A0A8S1NVH2_9CILI|nr:unnamed protein product [Paramecium sonneborni]